MCCSSKGPLKTWSHNVKSFPLIEAAAYEFISDANGFDMHSGSSNNIFAAGRRPIRPDEVGRFCYNHHDESCHWNQLKQIVRTQTEQLTVSL